MKERQFVDIGRIMDDIFEQAEDIREAFTEVFGEGKRPWWASGQHDFYPAYSYPPANIYLTPDRALVFEFAMAGFRQDDIDLQFRGDYMVIEARVLEEYKTAEVLQTFKRRIRFKNMEAQKYYVPKDKFDQDRTTAVLRNGVLRVTVPARDEKTDEPGIKVEVELGDEEKE